MKILASNRTLAAYSPSMRLALSFFLIFILLGLASSIALYHQQFDFSSEDAATHYRGTDLNQGGGQLNDPDNLEMHVQKSYRQLLEVTHFHLYIMPIVYLAVVHLYFLSTRPEWEKVLMTILTYVGLLGEIVAPWLTRYAGAAWSNTFWVSGTLITVTTVWMCLICMLEMWWPQPE